MKNLKQYIEEKLIINKNYKIDDSMTGLINILFEDVDEEDETWKPGEDNIIPYWVIDKMINDILSRFLVRQQRTMITNACEVFKVLPEQIYKTKYIRAILKQHISEKNYADECNKLLKITDKDFTNKEVKLINGYVMRLSMNEQYTMLFLYNKSNNIVMTLFIMEFKD